MGENVCNTVSKAVCVLIAVDGSKSVENAIDFYLSTIHKPGNNVILLHCMEPPYESSNEGMFLGREVCEQLIEKAKETARTLERKYLEKLKLNEITARSRFVFSTKPGHTVVEVAGEENVTMIVMGTRGMSNVRRTLLGSVSDYVIHHAHCPVTVVRCPSNSSHKPA